MFGLKGRSVVIVMFILAFCLRAQDGSAQTDSSDSKKQKAEETAEASQGSEGAGTDEGSEMVLDEILIEALIEKPNVAIIPSRKLSTLEEIEFIDRSFEKELKAVPRGLFVVDRKAEQRKSIERLRAILKQHKK